MIETIDDLTPDPRNANQGSERGNRIIEQSVRQRGAGRSGLAASDGTMIAGSQTLQKMAELGIPIKPVHTTGEEWVVVIRDDIEPGSEEATLLAIEDNRAAETGITWDAVNLGEIAAEFDLSSLFFPHELATIIEGAGTAIIDAAELWKGMPEFEYKERAFKSIAVHFENEQDYEEFARLIGQTLTPQTRYIWHPYRPNDNLKELRYEVSDLHSDEGAA